MVVVGLVVLLSVAFVGILAAIAIPNFLEAKTRAKVSKSMAEVRNVALSLEAYYVDYSLYPPPCEDPGGRLSSKYLPAPDPEERSMAPHRAPMS